MSPALLCREPGGPMTVLLSLVVGIAFGCVTKLLHLPLPAPNAFAGIVAVAGVYLGALLVGAIK